jgi:ATP-dependent exoDNAse (exonuclease V) beta subunit
LTDIVTDEGVIEGQDPNLARAAGTTIHMLLEHWDFKDPAALRDRIDQTSSRTAHENQVDETELAGAVERIVDRFLATDLPRFLAGVEILGREVPVLFRDRNQATVHGYVDIVYRHEGRVHVADYKTDETTTVEHAKVYAGQLADYVFAIEHALNLSDTPVGEVLFIRSGDRIPVVEGEKRTS